VEDPKLTAFLQALRNADVKDLGNDMQLISFGPGAYFPTDSWQCRSALLVRNFFGALFDRVASLGASLLTGVPGTGKSWWLWYVVYRLLQQDAAPAIVWQTFKFGISQCVMFKDGKAYVGHLDAFAAELGDAATW
jgi:hypothetical protein